MSEPQAVIVAGPTCSGKSALAMALACRLGGVVISADSMQVYRELRILTARPTQADEAAVPHALYGVRPAAMPGSVAWWRDAALDAMAQARDAGAVPILCGGTGLYFAALTGGLAPVPDPGPMARAEARALLATEGAAALHARLAAADPATAAGLRPTDAQRIARAWEVWRGTGRGLAAWQAEPPPPPPPWRFAAIRLDPPRPVLRAAISTRFAGMLASGAVAEVRALLALGLDPALPVMRAVGVQALAAHLRGEVTLDHAAAQTCLATQRYLKRQATWFRHHDLTDPKRVHMIHARFTESEQFSESLMPDLVRFIHEAG